MSSSIKIINPRNNLPLSLKGDCLVDTDDNRFPIINGVPRIAEMVNYTESFGMQWNKFDKIQLDRDSEGHSYSKLRFFAETKWEHENLSGKNILEVGSGAGRFSRVVLAHTKGTLFSVDYSDAVTVNYKNNGDIAPDRLHLYQANLYEMPFPNSSFDKVFCFGVLQHTPNFEESVKTLISKLKPGGEIVVDFYPYNGWWTKICAKYLLRPFTRKMSPEVLLGLIERNIDWLIKFQYFLSKFRLDLLSRFLPVCNIKESIPETLSPDEIRDWSMLDTFDQYSAEYDNPQRLTDVVAMFEKNNIIVTFAGHEYWSPGKFATVVRGRREK